MLKFTGINISSYDTKKMTEFYRDKLGLPVIGDEFKAGCEPKPFVELFELAPVCGRVWPACIVCLFGSKVSMMAFTVIPPAPSLFSV